MSNHMLGILALSLSTFASAQSPSSLKPLWPVHAANGFHQGLQPEIGFSFTYNGRKTGPGSLPDWKISGTAAETTFRHPSGLVAIRTSRTFPEFDAFEYTVRFRNESQSVLPALSAVNAMDVGMTGEFVQGLSAVTSGGGAADDVYPPKDFALQRTWFGPMTPLDGQITLTAAEGYSSRINLPFFFVENQAKGEGIYVGIGWTGDWKATIGASYKDKTLRLRGGMNGLDLKLQPGEEISGPTILIGAYRGPLRAGSNALRRLTRAHYFSTKTGSDFPAPILFTTWFDIGTELNEPLFKKLVDRASAMGQEVLMMDAGWYKNTPTFPYTNMHDTWIALSNSLGNWDLGEDLNRFPSGLKVLADYVRAKGMRFGLWFEPERAGPPSHIAKSHPDWMLYHPHETWALVDFGNPEVVDYFSKMLDRYITQMGISYLRWDQNQEELRYWTVLDPPDRKGIHQIRHLEGVHKVEDYIRQRHPDMLFESCASGGQRIDLPTLERRQTIWISDQTMDPHIVRFHLEGLNHFIPGNRQLVNFTPPTVTYQKPGFTFPDIAYQSYFGGAFGASGRLHEWPQAMQDQAKKHFAAFKKIRRYLAEDYYLLAPQSPDLDNWSGWQFHDPKLNEGFVQAFRIHSAEPTKKLVLYGLDAKSDYQFTDLYSGKSFTAAGAKLTSQGLQFELPEMSSKVLLYKRR